MSSMRQPVTKSEPTEQELIDGAIAALQRRQSERASSFDQPPSGSYFVDGPDGTVASAGRSSRPRQYERRGRVVRGMVPRVQQDRQRQPAPCPMRDEDSSEQTDPVHR